jgi:hypothetical protein
MFAPFGYVVIKGDDSCAKKKNINAMSGLSGGTWRYSYTQHIG